MTNLLTWREFCWLLVNIRAALLVADFALDPLASDVVPILLAGVPANGLGVNADVPSALWERGL